MLQDLRFALHLIVKDRWYSVVAIVALSLGIGLNATVFTLVNAVILRGLPYKDSHQLYTIGALRKDNPRPNDISLPELSDWQAPTRSCAGLAGTTDHDVTLSSDGNAPQAAQDADLTSNTF